MNFPSKEVIDILAANNSDGIPTEPRAISAVPYPNLTSPARKEAPPTSPTPGMPRPEDAKDSPDNKKKQVIKTGPVLKMVADRSNTYYMDESLFTNLRDIFEAVISQSSRTGVVSPHRFLEILRRENEAFRSAMHQDAHEFLNLLLNEVLDNVEAFSKQHPNLTLPQANGTVAKTNGVRNGLDTHWVHDLFEGLLTSETRCLTCENTSQRDEVFLDLSVDLAAHTSVTSCLRKFSEEEMLCERNKFHCDNCGGLQEAEKRMKIKRLPRILALHLKRFKYTEDLQRLHKLFHKVVYPFYLRLFNTTDDAQDADRLYELYAVVVHIGGGPYHGHYVSIVKTQDRGWLLFDDELVEPVDKAYVLSFFGGEPVPSAQDAKQLACAYVLFYQETTLEAMLREQEMEGQQAPPAASRTSDAEAAATAAQSLAAVKNGLHQTHTVTTPGHEEMEHMETLAHAVTAPVLPSPPAVPMSNPIGAPLAPVKSKKEIKAEEKAAKAQQKADQRALEQKRRDMSARRIEAWKKQDEELKRVMEESKLTATEESKRRGEEPAPLSSSPAAEKGSGFSKFTRASSMSLRGKPKLFSSIKEKTSSSPVAPPPAPSSGMATAPVIDDSAKATALQQEVFEDGEPAEKSGVAAEEQSRRFSKHRFSFARKKASVA